MEETDSSSIIDKSSESQGDNHSFIKKINTFSDESYAFKETQIPKKDIKQKKYLHCKNDFWVPNVKYNKYEKLLEIKCPKCHIEKKVTFGEAYKDFIYCSDHLDVGNFIKCKEPGHEEKKFKYYCFKCERNLCKFCLQNKLCNHEDEDKFIFKQKLSGYKNIADGIQEKINSLKLIDTPTKELIETNINNFNELQYNYSYFKNMEVLDEYLNDIINKKIIKKYN